MKWLIVNSIFIFQTGLAQIPVFQVLYAEKASLSNGTTLKSLDKLLDETIHVADSGYLVLIHETGIPVELSGDTTISLKEVYAILNPPVSEKEKKNITKSKLPFLRYSYQMSVGLNYLFLSDGPEAQKTILGNAWPVMDSDLRKRSVVKYPPLMDSRIYFDDDVKVVWLPRLTNGKEPQTKLKIKLINEFSEELISIPTSNNEFILAKSELDKLLRDNQYIIVIVEDSREKQQVLSLLCPFFTKTIRFPYSKEIKTPAAALMAGYLYETYLVVP